MDIVYQAYVNQNGAYYSSGGLIEGTQRILINHPTSYWQQGNFQNYIAVDFKNVTIDHEISEAIYVGRIPTHLGHFIIEGMARLCDVVNLDKPIIGYITNGYLPEGILPTPENEIRWVIGTTTNEKFYEINENETYMVNTLYVPTLPYHLSHSCPQPWRMSNVTKQIVETARMENDDVDGIEHYYLSRYNDINDDQFVYSDPYESLSRQIAKISHANNLYGKVGSNTHLSIFAQWNAKTMWTPRGNYKEGDRNQLVCDLVKTYNKF